ncbi:glycosyltransferase [Mariniflexile litorale]|uniref:Glycosyltransferase n=1 Tax=Mariniflexile litorale TaxID=3045158 RepID=A0AAU7ED33_9FLAO|nr:glycosyltransferase [Mariniflexile sp. KMM 9835]MDQ8212211.1 glycosyltransferase [Mariniflexile sp. KMM 9835]
MITLVLTNRNRDLRIVEKCLQSLHEQTCVDFELFLVDYGSNKGYKSQLETLLKLYPKIQYIDCPVEGQLWHKCRAINIALQQTNTPYFLVGDIDLIFAPTFIENAIRLAKPNEVHYFQYGFLSQEESLANKNFGSYELAFRGSEEVTGTTLFPTTALKVLHGYDEFYHGWGAEDTDVHIRMKNAGNAIFFYDKAVLVKHQWHPKVYRSKFSKHPFHSKLERINHSYMLLSYRAQRTIVNQNIDWGSPTLKEDYEKLTSIYRYIHIKCTLIEVNALLAQMANFNNEVILIEITPLSLSDKVKNILKHLFGRKHQLLYNMEVVNNLLLEAIIKQFRNNPYSHTFNRSQKSIQLKMYFK